MALEPTSPSKGARSGRRYLACAALIGPLVALWSLATPLGAAYDEQQHLWRSAALVRGQFSPPDVHTSWGLQSRIRVPGELVAALGAKCTAFNRDVPASCAREPRREPHTVTVINAAGRYPPTYYMLIGAPTLIAHGYAAAWGARAVSGVVATALLALALYVLWFHRPSRTGAPGFAVALTPMCLFLGGVTNPSGVEIAAAMAVWATVLSVGGDRTLSRGVLWGSGVAAVAVVVTRPLGPLILTIILLVGMLVGGRERVWTFARDSRLRGPVGLVAFAVLAQVAWLLFAGAPHLTAPPTRPHLTPLAAVERVLAGQVGQVRLMIGRFGYGETPVPLLTYLAWAAAFAILVLVTLRLGGRRRAGVALVLAAAIVTMQLSFDLIYLKGLGLFWGARYSMPIALGIPLLFDGPSVSRSFLARMVPGLTAVGHFAAFCWALHRFTVGAHAPLLATPQWQPPGGVWFVVVLFGAAITTYTAFLTSRPSAVA